MRTSRLSRLRTQSAAFDSADDERFIWRRVRLALGLLGATTIIGTLGYVLAGLEPFDALYMTVVTISTVGYMETPADPADIDGWYRAWSALLIIFGVGTALYTLSVTLETVLEYRLSDQVRRRQTVREIEKLDDHVIVCGYGRLGRKIAQRLESAGRRVVVIDKDEERMRTCPYLRLVGDCTEDEILIDAGIGAAHTLVAATDTDADNLYLTLTARTLRSDLFIVARARVESAESKLLQAGADRVVNPQVIGGERIAALTLQPHVSEFLDVVMHDANIEFRLEEVLVNSTSTLAGQTIRSMNVRERTGALVLAVRRIDGEFVTNPSPETVIDDGSMLIAIGTSEQLDALTEAAGGRSAS